MLTRLAGPSVKRTKTLAAVAVTVTAIVGTCGTGVAVAQPEKSGAEAATFCVEMPDSVGLYPGNPVTQMGFPVGKVDSVEQKGTHVEVRFTTDGGRVFPADVQAVTRSKSILADRSLELVGNYESGPQLTPESCIPLGNSYTPKTISEVVGSAADFIEALSPEAGDETVEMAVTGLEKALRGQGENARQMMIHAANAMENPDGFIADIGSSISNMAPLTEEALVQWAAIKNIADNMPKVVSDAMGLWPGTIDVCVGIGWLVALLDDIQRNYGDDIWPFVQGQAVEAVKLAAQQSRSIGDLVSTIPSMSNAVAAQTRDAGAVSMEYTPPKIALSDDEAARLCDVLESLSPGSCKNAGTGARVTPEGIMNLLNPIGATR
ncbi:mammalian cell entry protein [Rhodococcus pyridinivorans KG-16]|uniref:Mammalian cell entry protein n=1 Tax=Rhodococcus pyridinivorans KG-16 TaxID=1441730 RepID=A0A0V9URW7_9NOCA|nr:mammalian cell entry protein [Rhodococcus pyridinivorans KG-16]